MSDERSIDLNYIGRSLDRLVTEVATMRDDITVLAAITSRLDHNHSRLLDELRAIHSQISRMAHRADKLAERVDALEKAQEP
jgi:uncharacterized protein YoxC